MKKIGYTPIGEIARPGIFMSKVIRKLTYHDSLDCQFTPSIVTYLLYPMFGFIFPMENIFDNYRFDYNNGWTGGTGDWYKSDQTIDEFFLGINEPDFMKRSEVIIRANKIPLQDSYFYFCTRDDDPHFETLENYLNSFQNKKFF